MNCSQVRQHLSEYIDRELTGKTRREVQEHLQGCPRCRREYEQLLAAANLVRTLPRQTAPEALLAAVQSTLPAGGTPAAQGRGFSKLFSLRTLSWASGLAAAAAILLCVLVSRNEAPEKSSLVVSTEGVGVEQNERLETDERAVIASRKDVDFDGTAVDEILSQQAPPMELAKGGDRTLRLRRSEPGAVRGKAGGDRAPIPTPPAARNASASAPEPAGFGELKDKLDRSKQPERAYEHLEEARQASVLSEAGAVAREVQPPQAETLKASTIAAPKAMRQELEEVGRPGFAAWWDDKFAATKPAGQALPVEYVELACSDLLEGNARVEKALMSAQGIKPEPPAPGRARDLERLVTAQKVYQVGGRSWRVKNLFNQTQNKAGNQSQIAVRVTRGELDGFLVNVQKDVLLQKPAPTAFGQGYQSALDNNIRMQQLRNNDLAPNENVRLVITLTKLPKK